jgi:DNA-binding response OmpR family regulator
MNQTKMTLPKILLCEDETILAIDLKAMLEQYGYKVVGVVDNGADALAIAGHQPIDIALIDIELNGAMNGIEVANSLRNTYDIPSIFLTGRTDMETFLAAKTTNPYGFLTKPVDIAQLDRTIELALQQHAKEKTLRAEAQANAMQVDILMQHFPVTYDEEGRNFFGSMVRIAGGTSHHLNNMLFAIQGNLEWLTACSTVGGFEKRYIQAALDACTAAANLLKHRDRANFN